MIIPRPAIRSVSLTGLPAPLMLTNGDHALRQKAHAAAEAEIGRPFNARDAITNSIEDQPEAETKINAVASAIRDAH